MQNKLLEDKLQRECYAYFHNNYPTLRGLLHHADLNQSNQIAGNLSKLKGSQAGRPDFELNYKGKTYFAELKLPHTNPSPVQVKYHKLLQEHGFDTVIVRSVEEFKAWIGSIV